MEKLSKSINANDPTISTEQEMFPPEWKKRIAEEKIVYSPYTTVDIPDISFPEFIFKYLYKNGDKTFMIDANDDRKLSYNCTADLSKCVASGLIRQGLQPGQVVSMFCDNNPEFVITFLAVASLGGIVAGVNRSYTIYEILKELQETSPTFLIADTLHASIALKAKEVLGIPNVFVIGETIEGLLPFSQLLEDDGTLFSEPFPVNPKDGVLYINYSSGTTGLPKGTMHTHFTTVAVLSQMLHPQAHCTPEGATVLAVSPFFHCHGLLHIWSIATTNGTAVICKTTQEDILSCIEKYKITCVPAASTFALSLVKFPMVDKYDLSSLKDFVFAGSPLNAKAECLVKTKYDSRVRQVYGMTEGYWMTTTPMDFPRLQSVGIPMPSTAMKVLDTETSELCGPGQSGEIYFRAPYIMKGYLKNPEATAALIDQDGWLRTGDIGYYDEDGYFYIVDRIKDLIKFRGSQVAPSELEDLLLTNPFVKDAAVVGLPDIMSGELPRAFVVLQKPKSISEEEIITFIAERTSPRKHLRGGVIFVDEIPKSPLGKILRRELRKMHL